MSKVLFDYIVQFKLKHDGCAPSYAEISDATGLNMAKIRGHLAVLETAHEVVVGFGYRHIVVVGSEWLPPKGWDNETV